MCRYANAYKEHWACFTCRKGFKQRAWADIPKNDRTESRYVKCPNCGKLMRNLGLDFKAPSQKDREQWQKVELLWRNGIIFSSCGCNGPGPRPQRLREVEPFLAEMQAKALRDQRARQNAERAELLKQKRRQNEKNALSE